NLTDDVQVATLVSETARVLAVNGYLLLYLITPQDGYYRPRIEQSGGKLVAPSALGMPQRIFSDDEIENFFQPHFLLKTRKIINCIDSVDGAVYQRELVGIILQRADA